MNHPHAHWGGPPGVPGPPRRPGPDGWAGPFPPPSPLPPGPPFPGPGFAPPGVRLTPRVRRGDVRAALLCLLAEEPGNGYQPIQRIRERSHGVWSPSPGSVYPALQQLEDEGLVRGQESGGSRTYRLTEAGRAYADERRDDLAEPWAEVARSVPADRHELRLAWDRLGEAFAQLACVADDRQVAAARRLLQETRRAIFRILADDALDAEEDE